MPTSALYQIPIIISQTMSLKPKSVLDIGFGFGKYGLLCREYLELWGTADNPPDYFKRKVRMDGLEIYQKYEMPHHKCIYDNLYYGDAYEMLDKLEINYDLALLIDVFEHFEKQRALDLLNKLNGKARYVLIATPSEKDSQGPVYGNVHEKHLSFWTKDEFEKMGAKVIFPGSSALKSVIALIGPNF